MFPPRLHKNKPICSHRNLFAPCIIDTLEYMYCALSRWLSQFCELSAKIIKCVTDHDLLKWFCESLWKIGGQRMGMLVFLEKYILLTFDFAQ